MGRSPFLRAAALAAAAIFLVTACGDDDTTTETFTTETTEIDSTTTTLEPAMAETTTTETTVEDADEATIVEVQVAGGEVTGGGRVAVDLGDTVTIRVTSDVDDHVHLHGYDVLADVDAGDTADLTFTADIPGVFEVELEDAGLPLLELQVS